MIAPWADVCYFADASWWQWQIEGRAKTKLQLTADQVRERFAAFDGQKCSIQNSGGSVADPDVHLLRNMSYPINGNELSRDPQYLGTGSNSGFQALNLAILTGARTVLLLGFDAREPDGKEASHWFGDHPVREAVGAFAAYRRAFKDCAAAIKATGVSVLNCSMESAIAVFPKMTLDDALKAG